MIKFKQTLRLAAILVIDAVASGIAQAQVGKPNLLVIWGDDIGHGVFRSGLSKLGLPCAKEGASTLYPTIAGSPWRADAYVPVMFAGAGLEPATLSRAITPYDIAPTLANYLGIKQPSAANGKPLAEVLGN